MYLNGPDDPEFNHMSIERRHKRTDSSSAKWAELVSQLTQTRSTVKNSKSPDNHCCLATKSPCKTDSASEVHSPV